MNSFTLDRALGRRYFTKEDGKVYLTLPTGQVDEGGKPVYEDKVVSESGIDASAALTVTEYKKVDTVVTETRNALERFTTWMLGLTGVVDRFDGMTRMQYFYQRRTGNTSSRMTMNLEDDAPGTTISTEEAACRFRWSSRTGSRASVAILSPRRPPGSTWLPRRRAPPPSRSLPVWIFARSTVGTA
jgi:hypothetical protein